MAAASLKMQESGDGEAAPWANSSASAAIKPPLHRHLLHRHRQGSSAVVSGLIDALEKLAVWAFYPDASKPLHFLQGNFSPVPELEAPTPHLPVIGTIPVS
jgi:hypothetical protein